MNDKGRIYSTGFHIPTIHRNMPETTSRQFPLQRLISGFTCRTYRIKRGSVYGDTMPGLFYLQDVIEHGKLKDKQVPLQVPGSARQERAFENYRLRTLRPFFGHRCKTGKQGNRIPSVA